MKPDLALAAATYARAAEMGHAEAANNLGMCLALGKGVARNTVQAYKWFLLAEEGGSNAASRNRETLSRTMSQASISQARRLAHEWRPTPPPGSLGGDAVNSTVRPSGRKPARLP